MELKIYNSTGALKLTASPNSTSAVTREVMGEYAVSAAFTHTDFIQLDVNDYVLVEGVKYKLKTPYKPVKKNTQTFIYQVKFYAPIHDAEDALFLYEADGDTTTEFSYDGGPREHLQLWVDNMNRIAGAVLWSIGTVIAGDNKTIDYRNVYCWEAAFGSNGIAATFETELWADGYVVNLCKASRGEIVELGYQKGLTQLQPEENGEMRFFTRLFPLGSTRNIDPTKYGASRLQLPSREKFVDRNVELYGIKEAWEEDAFKDIYPKYVGSVTSVRSEQLTNKEGREYTVYYFKDSGMTFNPNEYEIPEYTKMLAFQTGDLAGRGNEEGSFEANWHADTLEWEIINLYPDEETQLPGGVIVPQPGDTYIPWNFRMPDEYNTAAEEAYRQAVDNFLVSYSFDPTKYTAPTDRHYIERNAVPLMVGQNVRLLSDEYFTGGYKDTRITKVVQKLNDLYQATLTCTDKIGTGWKTSVDNELSSLQYKLARQAEQAVVDIIKTTDTKTPSDWNVFSALLSLMKFHRKDKTDANPYLQKFLQGIEFGNFVSGLLGTGGAVQIDDDGCSHAEFDYLTIRKVALFIELIIQEAKHVGGMLIVSPSGMTISKVEETNTAYRCYFERTDGDRTLQNQFTVGTQARRQTFNLTNQAYYWRLVTEVGDDYVDLSKTDCDTGSTIPLAGDELVGLGHRTDKTRQSAIIISAFGTDSPSIKYYQGIDSYNLVDKAVKMDYYDPVSGRYKSVTYGDTYVGAKDGSTYVKYDQDKGVEVKGVLHIENGSTGAGNLSDLPEEVQKAAEFAVKVGGVNLLLNSGFTGDYETEELDENTELTENTELYSKSLKNWSGSATVQEDADSASGRSVVLGDIQQTVESMISKEYYVMSFKAKGTQLTFTCGNYSETVQLTSSYQRYSYKFTFSGTNTVRLYGTSATLCEPQLERGTIATDWSPSPEDNDKTNAKFQAIQHIINAWQDGSVDVLGGLILAMMIQLGNYKNGTLQKVTAGISGIYNDDDDVFEWGGGTLEQAIYTVMKYKENPRYQPTDEELVNMAKVVITHGGRAILNDVIVRGYIYALGGFFRGKVETFANGNRIVIDPTTNSLSMYDSSDNEVCKLCFRESSEYGSYPELRMTRKNASGSVQSVSVYGTNVIARNENSDGTFTQGVLSPLGVEFFRNTDTGAGQDTAAQYLATPSVRVIDEATYVTSTDEFLRFTPTAGITAYMPEPSKYPGKKYYIKLTSGSVRFTGGSYLDANSYNPASYYDLTNTIAIIMISDGTHWCIFYCG